MVIKIINHFVRSDSGMRKGGYVRGLFLFLSSNVYEQLLKNTLYEMGVSFVLGHDIVPYQYV